MSRRREIIKQMAGYIRDNRESQIAFRIKKCGGRWSEDMDKEFAWRLDNKVPMGLSYKEAREWVKKKKE